RSAPSSPVCARVIRVPHRYRFVLHVPSTIQSSPLSLHDALPISPAALLPGLSDGGQLQRRRPPVRLPRRPGSPGPPAAARLRDAAPPAPDLCPGAGAQPGLSGPGRGVPGLFPAVAAGGLLGPAGGRASAGPAGGGLRPLAGL